MARIFVIAALAAAAAGALVVPASAQFGSLFGNDPPRPPGSVPVRPADPIDRDSQFQQTNYPPPAYPAPPAPQSGLTPETAVTPPTTIQSQPLPPLPGAAPPGPAAAPGASPASPDGGTAALTPGGPGVPPAAAPAAAPSGAPTPAQPGSEPANAGTPPSTETVEEPPANKIVNPVAVFTGLDKITGRTISFEAKMGETVQFGALQVTPRACYTRPPTENTNTDGFVEVDEVTLDNKVKRIFSGWMFASSPGLHAVEHPIYDVWLIDCKGGAATATAEATPPPAPAPAPVAAPARPAPPNRQAAPARPTSTPPR